MQDKLILLVSIRNNQKKKKKLIVHLLVPGTVVNALHAFSGLIPQNNQKSIIILKINSSLEV